MKLYTNLTLVSLGHFGEKSEHRGIEAGTLFRMVGVDSCNFILKPIKEVEHAREIYISPEILKVAFKETEYQ